MANKTYIKVYWDDLLDNYNVTKEREIQRYFDNKYDAKSTVIFRAIKNASSESVQDIQADATDQVMDVQYQRKLMKRHLEENQIDVNWEHLIKLDGTVNAKIASAMELNMRYKKFSIDYITLNNFLSYAPIDQTISMDKLRGLNIVHSMPQNKAGKTSGIVDALLFVFFGKTTKTDVLEDVFNKYTDDDKVSVKAALDIDGDKYMIERVVTRTLKRDKSSYTIKSSVEFYTPLADGTWANLKGEKRQATDKIITDYIGKYEDFLLTIITTIKNFYSLIESKPTERGKIFTRFIGVEILAEKAEMCKTMRETWIKTSKLNTTSLAALEEEMATETIKLEGYTLLANNITTQIAEVDAKIISQKKDIEIATLKKHQNVDETLYKVREEEIREGIILLETTISAKNASITALKSQLNIPKINFDIDLYNELKVNRQEQNNIFIQYKTKKDLSDKNIQNFKDGEFCMYCKQALKGVDHSKEIAVAVTESAEFEKLMNAASNKVDDLTKEIDVHEFTKEAWATYDKAVLVIERNEVELEVFTANLQRGQEKLSNYLSNKTFIDANRLIDTEIAQLKRVLENIQEDREMKLLTKRGHEKDIENANKIIQKLTNERGEVVRDEIINKIYQVYMGIFGKNGISKMILGTMVPILNSYLNQMMTDTVPFRLEIRLNDKNEVEFWMVDEDGFVEKKLNAGSGYESTISLLALRCVLSKVCSLPKPNIVVFDEVFGQVGDENLPLLGAFFERMKEYFDSIFIITHNPMMAEWADNSIVVKKIDNLTYLHSNDTKTK